MAAKLCFSWIVKAFFSVYSNMKSWVEKYAGESQSLNRRHLFDKADRQNFSTSALKLN